VKLGKNDSEICAMLSNAHEGEAFLSDINGSKGAFLLKSLMKAMLITFFNMKGTVHFEFIPQGQTINQAYYIEVLKQLSDVICRKKPELSSTIGFSNITRLHFIRSALKGQYIRGRIQKFSDWPPEARAGNGTALCY
jgi:hypothetical protein